MTGDRSPRRASPRRPSAWPLVACLPWALAALACGSSTSRTEQDELLTRLRALPGVAVQEITPRYGYPRAFTLDITQPVDHGNPSGPSFTQRAYLSHLDERSPLVFGTYGYGATEQSGEELASLLRANGLYVTHRYFPGSRPQPTDWRFLDIRQAASDHHRVASLLKQVYAGPWVTAGASKSGMTALFHRRFFPGDVAATVAYVAPVMFELGDERFLPWVAGLGTPEGQRRIHDFQRSLLEDEEALLPAFEAWFSSRGLPLSVPAGPVFEEAVAEYEWSFWQRHVFDEDDIPGPDQPPEARVAHLAEAVRLQNSSDASRDYFAAYVYQVYTQLGSAAMDLGHLDGLFRHEPLTPHQEYGFPAGLPLVWDGGEAMRDVVRWVQTEGREIVLVYGGVDPWTGGAIDTAGNPGVVKVVQPGADHQVRIANLDQRDLVAQALTRWTGVPVTFPTAQAARELDEPVLRPRPGLLPAPRR